MIIIFYSYLLISNERYDIAILLENVEFDSPSTNPMAYLIICIKTGCKGSLCRCIYKEEFTLTVYCIFVTLRRGIVYIKQGFRAIRSPSTFPDAAALSGPKAASRKVRGNVFTENTVCVHPTYKEDATVFRRKKVFHLCVCP